MEQKYVTIWSKWPSDNKWVIERTQTLNYAKVLFGIRTKIGEIVLHNNGREYAFFPEHTNPNN